ncbi:MAG: hypothetical protein MJZ75_03960 [Paludibacteraceae bacterium]|nr:hypothetical protein [Paludibacteraceae bacterium]
MQAKSQQAGSPLSFMFQNVTETQPAISQLTKQQDPVQTQTPSVPESDITKLRTDNATYCKFGKKERYIIQTIYDAIYAAIADDMMRESLINRIESALIK